MQGRIELRLGLECEYFEDYMPWLRDTIREYRLDYVIFGNHFYRTDERYPYFGSDTRSAEMLDLYAESAIRGMETGLYAYLAHPDLFMRSYGRFDGHCARISREICRRASRLRMPLEYNVSMIAYNEAHGVAGVPHRISGGLRPTRDARRSSASMPTTTVCSKAVSITTGPFGSSRRSAFR